MKRCDFIPAYLLYIGLGMLICPPTACSIVHSIFNDYKHYRIGFYLVAIITVAILIQKFYLNKKKQSADQQQVSIRAITASYSDLPTKSPILRIDDPLTVLTPQERTLVEYVLKGYTGISIAGLMNISVETQKSYRKSVYSKLGIHSKEDLFRLTNNE